MNDLHKRAFKATLRDLWEGISMTLVLLSVPAGILGVAFGLSWLISQPLPVFLTVMGGLLVLAVLSSLVFAYCFNLKVAQSEFAKEVK